MEGNLLKEFRQNNGYELQDIADFMNVAIKKIGIKRKAEIKKQHISNWELGVNLPQGSYIYDILSALLKIERKQLCRELYDYWIEKKGAKYDYNKALN